MAVTASSVLAQDGDFSIELVNGIGVRHGESKLVAWITPFADPATFDDVDMVGVEFIIDGVSYVNYLSMDALKWVPGQGAWLGTFYVVPETAEAITLTNSGTINIFFFQLNTDPWSSNPPSGNTSSGGYYPINMPSLPGFLPPYS